jgi:hypothetical protein
MNQYLVRLRTLNSEKGDTCSPDKTDKTHPTTGSVSFVSSSGSPFSEKQSRVVDAPSRADLAPRALDATTCARVLSELERRCPDHVDEPRWRLAIDDARRFLTRWGEQAEALRWTARDLFGLHKVPANPDTRYRRLSRYDCTGLIWLLQGQPVVALTDTAAAIQSKAGSITTYRKRNKPAYGPLGDALDDFVA